MSRGQKTVYIILAAIPVLFLLFLLAIVNVLLMLAGVALVLIVLLLLKQKKPELFDFGKKADTKEDTHSPTRPPEIKPAKPQVYMVLNSREDFGARRIVVNKTAYSIGRNRDNDFVIEGSKISRYHLKIEYNSIENVCYAIDTGSSNGTFLNTERMIEGKRYRLVQGDRIMIDDRAFVVDYAHY